MEDQFLQVLIEYGLKLAVFALTLLCMALVGLGKSWLVAKIGEAKFTALGKWAETFVRSLEQEGLLPKWSGEQKKAMAMIKLRQIATALGVEVSDDYLNDLIEEVVQIINTEAGKFAPKLEYGLIDEDETA